MYLCIYMYIYSLVGAYFAAHENRQFDTYVGGRDTRRLYTYVTITYICGHVNRRLHTYVGAYFAGHDKRQLHTYVGTTIDKYIHI